MGEEETGAARWVYLGGGSTARAAARTQSVSSFGRGERRLAVAATPGGGRCVGVRGAGCTVCRVMAAREHPNSREVDWGAGGGGVPASPESC